MIDESLTDSGLGLSTPGGKTQPTQNALRIVPADRATLLPNDEAAACEKLVSRCTTQRTLKYHANDVEDLFKESRHLEDKNMPPAIQPARDPLADVFPSHLLPGEHSDIRIDVQDLLANAHEWLATPNSNFGGRRPSDLIGTPEEHLLRETIRSVIYSGMA